jgi:hypothetical protein
VPLTKSSANSPTTTAKKLKTGPSSGKGANPGTTISQHPFNPYHLREYTQAELNGLLRPFFGQIEFFGQSAFGVQYQQALSTIGKCAPAFAVKLHQLRKLLGLPWENFQRHWPRPLTSTWEPEILLALCSQPRS